MSTSPAALWPEVVGGVELEFRSSTARPRLSLLECSEVGLNGTVERCVGSRRFAVSVAIRACGGFRPLVSMRVINPGLERDYLMALDADPGVVGVHRCDRPR